MDIVADRPPISKPSPAEQRGRELADIHQATCRARRQGLLCSTCVALNGQAARLEVSS